MEPRSYSDPVAWQKAIDLAEATYRATSGWPSAESFGLTSQTRRAAASIPANIAEGKGRTGSREFLHHLSIAHGSLWELETHLHLARRLDYLAENVLDALLSQTAEVSRLIRGLIRSLQT